MLLRYTSRLSSLPTIRINYYQSEQFKPYISIIRSFSMLNNVETKIPNIKPVKYQQINKRYYSDESNKSPNSQSNNLNNKSYYSKETIMQTLNSLKEDIKKTTYVVELNEVIDNVVKEMEKKKISIMKIKITISILILIIVLALYDVITSWMSGQVNVITEKSLEDEELKKKLIILCKSTIKELVESNEVQDDVTRLLKNVVVNLTNDKEIQSQITELLRICIIDLVHNKEIQMQIEDLLKLAVIDLTQNPEVEKKIRELIVKIIENAANDESIHNHGGKIISGSIYNAFFGNKK
ncbi:DUF445 protein [Fadolivirus algeromassiliense]|jgi:hypothetical protein|uniref:DUF445 protein n=1 Tax=Fadolivirus FV1/VV64 TaxID=3070911 RepID=A0A7D3QWP9_9VIRU|nr:DUF445 protein [Fadolivirus algeromassiliense]QKF94819.1 DUF445 protein [Fadolivirus FV1/VV64]